MIHFNLYFDILLFLPCQTISTPGKLNWSLWIYNSIELMGDSSVSIHDTSEPVFFESILKDSIPFWNSSVDKTANTLKRYPKFSAKVFARQETRNCAAGSKNRPPKGIAPQQNKISQIEEKISQKKQKISQTQEQISQIGGNLPNRGEN